jgi:hypothetical protein
MEMARRRDRALSTGRSNADGEVAGRSKVLPCHCGDRRPADLQPIHDMGRICPARSISWTRYSLRRPVARAIIRAYAQMKNMRQVTLHSAHAIFKKMDQKKVDDFNVELKAAKEDERDRADRRSGMESFHAPRMWMDGPVRGVTSSRAMRRGTRGPPLTAPVTHG